MRPSAAVSSVLFLLCALVFAGVGMLIFLPRGNPGGVGIMAMVGVFVGSLVASSVKVVAEWERMVVLRLGRFRDVRDPGMNFLIPVIDTPMFVEMRVQTVDIPRQQTITQDNVPVMVNGVIFYKVVDARSAALKVESYRQAIARYSMATLRDAVGSLTLDELLSHQERLETEIARNVEVASAGWGLHVEAIKIEDLDVPEDLKKMMSRQASSEREKRATIIKADGDRLAATALAEAASVMAQSPGAMQLRALQTIDGLGPSNSNTVVLALPIEVLDAMRAFAGNRVPSATIESKPNAE